MCWSNFQEYLVTGDQNGTIVYCNEMIHALNKFQAHGESQVRDISFSLSSVKFVSCSDDGTAKVWDFATS
jgi:polyadenylation factor subunit 2